MIGFKIQIPKTGEARKVALDQIGVMLRQMEDNGETFDTGGTQVSAALIPILKDLTRKEGAVLLASVYETLPSIFEDMGYSSIQSTVIEVLKIPRLQYQYIFAIMDDKSIAKLTKDIVGSNTNTRHANLKTIAAASDAYVTAHRSGKILLSHFEEMFVFDFLNDTRYAQTIREQLTEIDVSDADGYDEVRQFLGNMERGSLEKLANILDVDTRNYSTVMRNILQLGPDEIIQRLSDQSLILTREKDQLNDPTTPFEERLESIIQAWIDFFKGFNFAKASEFGDLENNKESQEFIRYFVSAYLDEDEDEEEEEDDEEEEDEDDCDSSDDVPEEDDIDDVPAKVKRRTPQEKPSEDSEPDEEDEISIRLENSNFDELVREVVQLKLLTLSSARRLTTDELRDTLRNHYELTVSAPEEDDHDFLAMLVDLFDEANIHTFPQYKTLIQKVLPSVDIAGMDSNDLREQLLDYADAMNEREYGKLIIAFSEAMAEAGIQSIAFDKEAQKYRIADPETKEVTVTEENYKSVIPTLNRQELIAAMSQRGYSERSLNKLGATQLANSFMKAMDRMADK